MATVSLTGQDTMVINGKVLNDLADGDVAALTFPNDLMSLKIGKNGNALYAFNETGEEADAELRIIRGSSDDKFLQGLLNTMKRDPASFVLITGEFVKRVGDGQGNTTRDIYTMSGGVILKNVEAKDNVEGDTDQSVSIFTMKFSNAPRSLT